MKVVLSVTLTRLYCLVGGFHMSTNTLVKNVSPVFLFLPLFHWI